MSRFFATPVRRMALVIAVLLPLSSLTAHADVYWTLPAGQLGDWSSGLELGRDSAGPNDTAYIVNGRAATITSPGEICGTLSLGSSAGSGMVQMTDGGLSTGDEYVGNSGAAGVSRSRAERTVVVVLSVLQTALGAAGRITSTAASWWRPSKMWGFPARGSSARRAGPTA